MIDKKNFQHHNNVHENHEYENRKKKLMKIRKNGFSFPNNFQTNTNITKINEKYNCITNHELKKKSILVNIIGRITNQRIMGKASFVNIKSTIEEIQIYVTEKKISSEIYQKKFKKLDIGDIIGVTGILFKTKTKQLSIYCENIILLSKSLRPLPDKFHGLSNQEIKYRKRYLDLLSSKNTMKIFYTRSKILMLIREFMHRNDFIEVETPMMQNIPGGATARPFITYHNTLDMKMYLRVSPELYLKRLIIGGFERIYEINRNFRNEGISSKHNPEFTMMELYIAHANYQDLILFITNLLRSIIKTIYGSHTLQYQKNILYFQKPFPVLTMKNAIIHYNPNIQKNHLSNLEQAKKISILYEIPIKKTWTLGKIIAKIFECTTEKKLIQPTFITEYPIEISPLARRNNIKKNIADRFELFMGGIEIANGFSELNDPEDQKKRFLNKQNIKYQDNPKKILYDIEYIEAMEYGMPPTAGLGIGIDRLIMIITNQDSIRDVILFPTLRTLQNTDHK
ncbi:lysine--tRNA ligase [Buchnera aphidicola]|uniref:lysine--tRNA ligase n=1 Tax=Buchnera aphidicola TaxID=9 RepID=UPI003464C95A